MSRLRPRIYDANLVEKFHGTVLADAEGVPVKLLSMPYEHQEALFVNVMNIPQMLVMSMSLEDFIGLEKFGDPLPVEFQNFNRLGRK